MHSEFWLNVWENGNLNFHNSKTNPFLMKFWPKLGLKQSDSAFVPLCGKTLDMVWLAEQGHQVIGVELSRLAAEAFFDENNIEADISEAGAFTSWRAEGIDLLVGDFFNLTAEHLHDVRGIFDRAAMVALPEAVRNDYAQHLANVLPAGAKILLISFEYDQAKMSGPPYSVPYSEIKRIFESRFTVEKLDQRDLIEKAPGMQRSGLTSFEQHIYLLSKLDD
ncbi:MAG: thiopurine S-methyltransferase [Cellvibrionaceae bacterium]|jgi:thiopurine S-methyltransferase